MATFGIKRPKTSQKSILIGYLSRSNKKLNIYQNIQVNYLSGAAATGKSVVSKVLAKKINAQNWCTPPESIKHLRHLFDDGDDGSLRTAYYTVGNYIAALEVALILPTRPVVMDRYWHSTVVSAIAQAIHNNSQSGEGATSVPLIGDVSYKWPDDLLKPDAVILLDVSEEIRVGRHARRNTTNTAQEQLLKSSSQFRENVFTLYKNMRDPNVQFINGDPSVEKVVESIHDSIKHFLH